ncbi:MAG: hypothetical protein U0805_21820 [Pirellulales bacterium]
MDFENYLQKLVEDAACTHGAFSCEEEKEGMSFSPLSTWGAIDRVRTSCLDDMLVNGFVARPTDSNAQKSARISMAHGDSPIS